MVKKDKSVSHPFVALVCMHGNMGRPPSQYESAFSLAAIWLLSRACLGKINPLCKIDSNPAISLLNIVIYRYLY